MKSVFAESNPHSPIITVVAAALLVFGPVAYVLIAMAVSIEPLDTGGGMDMTFYILLIIAAFTPLVIPLVERRQIAGWKKNVAAGQTQMSPRQLLFSVLIVRMAFVKPSYIYGLVVFMISADLNRLLLFYPIGIIWTLIYWPTRARREKLLEKVESL